MAERTSEYRGLHQVEARNCASVQGRRDDVGNGDGDGDGDEVDLGAQEQDLGDSRWTGWLAGWLRPFGSNKAEQAELADCWGQEDDDQGLGSARLHQIIDLCSLA